MLSISRKYEFCAAHRLFKVVPKDHPCNCLHGHNYYGEVTLFSGETDPIKDMFIDFSILKSVINTVSTAFDHRVIFHHEDPLLPIIQKMQKRNITILHKSDPTVEHMSYLWSLMITRNLLQSYGMFLKALYKTKVVMYETQNSFAEYTLDYPGIDVIQQKEDLISELNDEISSLIEII